jgi:hypothetical protein
MILDESPSTLSDSRTDLYDVADSVAMPHEELPDQQKDNGICYCEPTAEGPFDLFECR